MRELKLLGIFIIITICSSCSTHVQLSQQDEAQKLNEMFSKIENLASSVSCENATNWTFTSYGSKACGGPVGYIAYSKNINVDLFISQIEAHKTAQKEFNIKWGVMSDCSIAQQPTDVICQDGKAVLKY